MREKSYTGAPRRKRMAEGLYIENGKWLAIYRDQDGRQRSKTLPLVRNVSQAKKARRTLLADLEAKRIAPASNVTVTALADQWLASRRGRVRARTYETDSRYVALVKTFFGRRRAQDVTPAEVERFLVALRSGAVGASGKPLAEWTMTNALKTLRMVMNKAMLDGTVMFNPAAASRLQSHSRPRQVNARQPLVLSAGQVDELVEAAVRKTPSFASVIATAAYTGARIREVLALRWCDIDAERKLIHMCGQINVEGTDVVAMKTAESERFVALVPRLEQYLGRQGRMAARWSADDDFVFSASRHRPKDYGNLRRALAVASKEAGLGRVRAHDLRHSFVSNLLPYGDLATISRAAGHANVGITAKLYSHALGSPEEQAHRAALAAAAAGLGH
jgi:integrase